ncbi:PKD domain-containing protein [Pedobacter sp. ASV28]|uniref:PKD domain-containing protein n=1 Tax=Pedobacter sp. ASV28 TaxID=2795123 RepID=UPI0018ECBAF9|nr:PKD domain-containing protein [Pedobacter sp. ASV28]
MKRYLLLSLLLITLFFSCKKDSPEQFPDLHMSVTEKTLTIAVNTERSFSVVIAEGKTLNNEWKLNGAVVGKEVAYTFKPSMAGDYTLVYTGSNALGSFSYSYAINVPVPVIDAGANSSKYISKVFEYFPAPGQHINQATLGSPEQAQKLVGGIANLVSLGGYGGYIIFGFDHSVVNQTGYDLAIYGNPSGAPYHFAEPGIVMVSQDKNGNGLPDDEWYELAGSEYEKATTIKNYEITYTNPKAFVDVPWTDNQGNSGVLKNLSKNKNHYPLFVANQDKITFKGTLLPSTLSTTGLVLNNPFEWGYTDSYSVGDDYAKNLYNSFDISWAVDKNGKKVSLKTVDFVKVYTAQNVNAGILGEISTDIKGAADLNIK